MDININQIIREVLYRYNFLGSVFASIEIVPDYNCYNYEGNPSAGASRNKISYHPDFVSSLDKEEQIFLLAHEGCHIMLKHHERAKGKNPQLWNIATDAIININLKKDNFKLIQGVIDRPDALGLSAERYYQKLLKEQQEQKENQPQNSENNNQAENGMAQSSSSQDNNQSNSSNSNKYSEDYKQYDVGHDTHSSWYTDEYDLEESKEKNSTSKENQQDNEKEEVNDNEVFRENRKQQKQKLENLRKNLVRRMLDAGKDTNSEILSFDFVGEKKDLIRWQKLLLDTTKIEEDWSFQNASIEYGVITPHLEEQPQPETEILIDTSGSVSNNLVRNFLRECKSLLHTSKIRVGCFDTKFYGFQEIRSEEDIDNFMITGRGGTDFNVAVEAFTGRAENKIIFTDGDANMPNKELNAIWIVYGNKEINPKGGKAIYISEQQLQELNLMSEEAQRKR